MEQAAVTTGCYAVVFANQRREPDPAYDETAARMVALASAMPGYLGHHSARGADGFGITVSYWESEAAIAAWKANAEHAAARERGRADWYAGFQLIVARVERVYGMGA